MNRLDLKNQNRAVQGQHIVIIIWNIDSPKGQCKENKKEVINALRYYKDKFAHLFNQNKVVSIHCYTKMKTEPNKKEKSLIIEKTMKGNAWSSK